MSSLKKNIKYQSLYQLIKAIFPLITVPYISRVLGPELIGIYTYTYTIAYYFVVLGMLGLEQYGNRCIAKVRDNRELLSSTFSELLATHVFFTIVSALMYYVYALFIAREFKQIFFIQGMHIIASAFDISWLYFGLEKFKKTVVRDIVTKTLSVCLIFLFVRDNDDLYIYCAILSGCSILNSLALWFGLRKSVSLVTVKLSNCKRHLKPLCILLIAVIAAHVYRMIDKVMLGWYGEFDNLGCYEYADKIVRIPLGFITAIGIVMISRMTNLLSKKNSQEFERIINISSVVVLVISFGLCFGLAAIAPEFIVLFLGDGYSESIILIQMLAITIPFISWNNYIRTQLLIPLQKDIIYTKAVVLGAIVNFALNCILIRMLSARGAALATIIAYIVVLIVQMYPVYKHVKGNMKVIDLIVFVFIGVIMFLAIRVIGSQFSASVLIVIIEVIAGMIIYGGLITIYFKLRHPEMYYILMNTINFRIKKGTYHDLD